jgi:hypothetical protein
MGEVRKTTQEDIEWGDPATTVTSAGGHVGHRIDNTYKLSAPYVDVRAYGAVGDGVTDDTAEIQAALDISGVVYLPKGTYMISNALTYKSNMVIYGAGNNLTIIKNLIGRTDTKTLLKPYLGSGSDNVYIYGITFDQNGISYSDATTDLSVSVDNSSNITFANVRFKDSITMALWSGTATDKLRVFNSVIDTSRGGGISLFGDILDVIVSGNSFYSCKDDALAFQDLSGGTVGPRKIVISNNSFINNNSRNTYGSTPHAILIYGGQNVTISGNYIDNTVSDGIGVIEGAALRASQISITGNVINNAGGTSDNTSGVPVEGIRIKGDHIIVSGNVINNAKGSGISVNEGTDIAVSGNVIHASKISGISFTDVVGGLIGSNTISDSGALTANPWGVGLISTNASSYNKNITITGNSIYDSRSGGSRTQTHGVYVAGDNAIYINVSNNSIYNNTTASIGGDYTSLSDSRFQDNFGTSKRIVGQGSLLSPNNTVDVTHNLGTTPTVVLITPWLNKSLYVSSRDNTVFTVTNASDNTTCAFDWIAEIQ